MFERDDAPVMDRELLEAAWRYQLMAPLLDQDLPRERRDEYRNELIANPVEHPWRGKVRVSRRTVSRWCTWVRREGLSGLIRRRRSDRGVTRALPEGALERALELREEDGRRTVPGLIRLMVAQRPEWEGQLHRSTLDRHLRALGSKRQRQRAPQGPFVAFEAKAPSDLWQGDILVGPVVLAEGTPYRCRVVCWLDDHSRFVCHLQAYTDERLPVIEVSLKRAILKFGRPARLFCDNAFVYSQKTFTLGCAQLGIRKIHSTPRYPVSRGKVERFFGVLRSSLLNEVENLEGVTLAQLNRYLAAWLDRYHDSEHSRTGQTPRERFEDREIRPVSAENLESSFWQWTKRDVSPTGEIKAFGNLYRVDPSFAGRKKVVIRFDAFDLSKLVLWEAGRVLATAVPEELVRRVKPGQPAPRRTRNSEAARTYLEELAEAHDERLSQELNLTRYRDPGTEDEEEDR